MKIGVFSFNTVQGLLADRLAFAAEARGFESLWVPEHTHIPVPKPGEAADPKTGMPMAGGDLFFLPEEYRHISDPFTTLAAAAAVTTTIKLETCVCLINQHHPINLAKHVATLDQLSGGRFIFGIGAGWNIAEMSHHGVEFKTRWRELRERLRALRTIWANDNASFGGEFVRFDAMWQFPKPLSSSGPPVTLGTLNTEFGMRQVARYGDGWLPLAFDLEETKNQIAEVRRLMETYGRDPKSLEVSMFSLNDEIQSGAMVERAFDAGADRVILRLPLGDEQTVIPVLDKYAKYL